MDTLFLMFMIVFPVALVLLLEKQCYRAAGCLLAITGVAWACLWSQQDALGAVLMPHFGYGAAIIGALVYLHGVKRNILRALEKQKQDLL